MRVILILFLCNIIALQKTYAQPDYYVTNYNNLNGLPSNSIKGLAYDSETGFLWIGSEGGLTKFDGHHLYNISLDGEPEFATRIDMLKKGPNDSIYFLTESKKLYVIRNSMPVRYTNEKYDFPKSYSVSSKNAADSLAASGQSNKPRRVSEAGSLVCEQSCPTFWTAAHSTG